MLSSFQLAAIAAFFASPILADDPFYLCKDNQCGDCPASVASSGTGYPNCVVYNSADVFAGAGFEGTDGGGYQVYFDVQQPQPGCATIVKSPANTEVAGCGAVIAAFRQPACAALSLEESFMVQFCCGNGDCTAAGAKKFRMGRDVGGVSIGSNGGVFLKYDNGTIITPAAVGPPPEAREKRSVPEALEKRSGQCTDNSWKADGETYTKPADNVQIVSNYVSGGTGGSSYTVTMERSQSWTTSIMAGFSFEEIFSLGVDESMTEETSQSKSVMVQIPAGQEGRLGFTSILTCSSGTGTCNGGDVTGEVCWGTKGPDDDVLGTYRVIISS